MAATRQQAVAQVVPKKKLEYRTKFAGGYDEQIYYDMVVKEFLGVTQELYDRRESKGPLTKYNKHLIMQLNELLNVLDDADVLLTLARSILFRVITKAELQGVEEQDFRLEMMNISRISLSMRKQAGLAFVLKQRLKMFGLDGNTDDGKKYFYAIQHCCKKIMVRANRLRYSVVPGIIKETPLQHYAEHLMEKAGQGEGQDSGSLIINDMEKVLSTLGISRGTLKITYTKVADSKMSHAVFNVEGHDENSPEAKGMERYLDHILQVVESRIASIRDGQINSSLLAYNEFDRRRKEEIRKHKAEEKAEEKNKIKIQRWKEANLKLERQAEKLTICMRHASRDAADAHISQGDLNRILEDASRMRYSRNKRSKIILTAHTVKGYGCKVYYYVDKYFSDTAIGGPGAGYARVYSVDIPLKDILSTEMYNKMQSKDVAVFELLIPDIF